MGYSDESWWERGACREVDPRIFDERTHWSGKKIRSNVRRADWREAAAVCGSCPVRRECEEYALSMPLDLGMEQAFIAGYTPDQMEQLRRRARRARS